MTFFKISLVLSPPLSDLQKITFGLYLEINTLTNDRVCKRLDCVVVGKEHQVETLSHYPPITMMGAPHVLH